MLADSGGGSRVSTLSVAGAPSDGRLACSCCSACPLQVDRMLSEHGIYLTKDGRMSMAGMKSADVTVVADAIIGVSR